MERPHRGAVLNRIPRGEHAGAKPRPASLQTGGQTGEFRRVFIGRIDQNQTPLLHRRQQGTDCFPGVAPVHRHLRVPAEFYLQVGTILGVQFAAGQPVIVAQQRADQRRGAGIEPLGLHLADIIRQRPLPVQAAG